jgi:hypothetical protein
MSEPRINNEEKPVILYNSERAGLFALLRCVKKDLLELVAKVGTVPTVQNVAAAITSLQYLEEALQDIYTRAETPLAAEPKAKRGPDPEPPQQPAHGETLKILDPKGQVEYWKRSQRVALLRIERLKEHHQIELERLREEIARLLARNSRLTELLARVPPEEVRDERF